MGLHTQASQLRLAQRSGTGNWSVPDVRLEGWASTWTDTDSDWEDVTDFFDIIANRLVSVGGKVDYSFLARRMLITEHNCFRLSFTTSDHNITTPQTVGEMTIIITSGVGDEMVRQWAVYSLAAIPEGRLEIIAPSLKAWPDPQAGDIVQFNGSWFI